MRSQKVNWKITQKQFTENLKTVLCTYRHGSSPPNFWGDLKISDQNNWGGRGEGGPKQKIKFGGGGPINIVGKGGHTSLF